MPVEVYNLQATLSATLMWLRREPDILTDAAHGINDLNKTENMEYLKSLTKAQRKMIGFNSLNTKKLMKEKLNETKEFVKQELAIGLHALFNLTKSIKDINDITSKFRHNEIKKLPGT